MKLKEDRFVELIRSYNIIFYSDLKFNKIIYTTLSGDGLLEYNFNWYTWVSYDKIWNVIQKEYNMTYVETQVFIKSMLFKYFKIKSAPYSTKRLWKP